MLQKFPIRYNTTNQPATFLNFSWNFDEKGIHSLRSATAYRGTGHISGGLNIM